MPSLRRVWILRDLLKFPCEPKKQKLLTFHWILVSKKQWVYCNPHIPRYRFIPVKLQTPWFFFIAQVSKLWPLPTKTNGTLQDSVDLTTTISSVRRLKSSKMCGYTTHKLIWLAGSCIPENFEKGCVLVYWIRFLGEGLMMNIHSFKLHPARLTCWTYKSLQITHFERKIIFQTSIVYVPG